MIGLPKSTEFNKRIPKQKFYDNLPVTPAIKKAFAEQIRIIYWRNKLAETTLNLAAGEQVTEIEVFEIKLTSAELDENVLRLIDRAYHIIFYFCWNMKAGIRRLWDIKKLRLVRQLSKWNDITIPTGWMRQNFRSIWKD